MNDTRFFTILMLATTMITSCFHNIELTLGSSSGVIMCALWEVCDAMRSKRIEIIVQKKDDEERVYL